MGYWNGLLRDGLTQGPAGGWTISLTLFAWILASCVGQKRAGFLKKTLLLFGGLIASQAFYLILREGEFLELGIALRLLMQNFLPGACLTAVLFFLGNYLFQRWRFDSGLIETIG